MNLKSLFLTFSALPMLGFGLPSGAIVEHGQADFHAPHTSQLEISCQDRTVINWDTFNIDSHEALKFIQSQGDAVLNRVTGHESGLQMSQIMGTLSSQGSVYIVNPEGILIGSNALIDVASFVATTLDISSSDFLKLQSQDAKGEGLQSLVLSGDSKAKILNLGTIKAASGDVHVVAYQVDNQGSIEARNGSVTLTAANEAVLQPAGKRKVLIRTRVNANSTDENSEANLADEGVSNSGVIKALEAEIGADGSLYKLAINHTGHIEAKTLTEEGGKIFLTSEKGSIKVDGTMVAKESIDGVEKGGRVEVMGERIALTEKANIDVSGKHVGGTALFGSDTRGEGMPFNAEHTTVAEGSCVNASALENGDGGKVVYWGDDLVNYYGSTLAEGGSKGGDGGFVEVSSHGAGFNKFIYTGHVSTLAPEGKTGTLLWDPPDVTIGNAESLTNASETNGTYTFSGEPAAIPVSSINTALASNNVIIDTGSGDISEGNGNITFNGTDITLIAGAGNTLELITESTGSEVSFQTGISATGVNFVVRAPNVYFGSTEGGVQTQARLFELGSLDVQLNREGGTVALRSSGNGATTVQVGGAVTIGVADGITDGDLTLEGASSVELNITGSNEDLIITVPGTVSIDPSGGEAGITRSTDVASRGAIFIGTSLAKVGAVGLHGGQNSSTAFIGEKADATMQSVTNLEFHISGQFAMSALFTNSSSAVRTYGAPLVFETHGLGMSALGGSSTITTQTGASSVGPGTININSGMLLGGSLGNGIFIHVGQAQAEHVFDVGGLTMQGAGGPAAITIDSIEGYDTVLNCAGDLDMQQPLDSITMTGGNRSTINVTNSGIGLEIGGGGHITASNPLTITSDTNITLQSISYIETTGGNHELRVIAGQNVVLENEGTALRSGDSGDVFIVTDNDNPNAPNAGAGNLRMQSGTQILSANTGGNIYVFSGFDENNRDGINDSATFNGATYLTLKGELDTQDENNKFNIYYNASSLPSEYGAPATFYYKETTPVEIVTEGVTEGANEVSSGGTSSEELSENSGISAVNLARARHIFPTRSFFKQYNRYKKKPKCKKKRGIWSPEPCEYKLEPKKPQGLFYVQKDED